MNYRFENVQDYIKTNPCFPEAPSYEGPFCFDVSLIELRKRFAFESIGSPALRTLHSIRIRHV